MCSPAAGAEHPREQVLRRLVDMQYLRNDVDFHRSTFRVRGCPEVFPAGTSERAIRVEYFGDEIERITEIDYLTGEILGDRNHVAIFPASHFVTSREMLDKAVVSIEEELEQQLALFRAKATLEAQRLEQRTRYDLEMLHEMGFCRALRIIPGI